MNESEEIRAAIQTVVKLMVDRPSEVTVSCQLTDRGGSLQVTVAREDLGKVIGKQGRTARALRVVTSAMGMTVNLPFSLDISE